MSQEDMLVATVVASWKLTLSRIETSIGPLSDEDLQRQVAPGKNRLMYLVGHLAAVHDRLFPLLGLGDRLHPELDAPYLTNPDRTLPDPVSPAELKAILTAVNTQLTAAMDKLAPAQWLEPHTAVSADDFLKDPKRNRLAVLLSRTNHASFHIGQMVLTR